MLSEAYVEINQPIFFYNQDTEEIFEKYNINNQMIKKKLGKIKQNAFEWIESVNSNFVKRRSNFHGLVLKGMVEFSGFDMNANSSYRTSAPYFAGRAVIREYGKNSAFVGLQWLAPTRTPFQ